jgi:signal transduction histidine kinase/ligand-binding sensor domain-containing protein/CheY-like chemotaxis protein/AraC-like DNA-binding protein
MCLLLYLALLNLLMLPGLQAWQKNIRFENITVEQGLPGGALFGAAQDRHGFMWFASENGLIQHDGYRYKLIRNEPGRPDSLLSNQLRAVYIDSQDILWVGTAAGLSRYDPDRQSFTHFRHDPDNPNSLGAPEVMGIFEDHNGILWLSHWPQHSELPTLSTFDPHSGIFTHYFHDPHDPLTLPAGAVTAFYEDTSGVLWLGTYAWDGVADLAYFDRESKAFRRVFDCSSNPLQCAQPTGPGDRLKDFRVGGIHEDSKGKLWISGSGNGLIRYDRESNTYTHFACRPGYPGSLTGKAISGNIIEDGNGLLWYDDRYKGLSSFEPGTGTFNHYVHDLADPFSFGVTNTSFSPLFQDRSGLVWAIGLDGSLSKFDPASLALGHYKHEPGTSNSLSNDSVVDIVEDENGILWALHLHHGLRRIDRATGIVTAYQHDTDSISTFHTLHLDRAGVLWLGTSAGLSRFDRSGGRFTDYPFDLPGDNPDKPPPANLRVSAISADTKGNLWLASMSRLSYFEPDSGKFTHYRSDPDRPDALHGAGFASVLLADDGSVWVGGSDGLSRLDPVSGLFTHYVHDPGSPDSISSNRVTAIVQDQDGAIWVGTHGGLDYFDPASKLFSHFSGSRGANLPTISSIVLDGYGNIWASVQNEGLVKLDSVTGDANAYGARYGFTRIGRGIWGANSELIWAGVDGINIFDPNELPEYRQDPVVVITDFRLSNRSVPVSDEAGKTPLSRSIVNTTDIELTYLDNLFSFEFAVPGYRYPKEVRFAYRLEGYDKDWIESGPDRRITTYTHVPPGDYVLRVKAAGKDGAWSDKQIFIRLNILPPWWQTWWAYTLYVIAFVLVLFGYIRLRTRNLRHRARLLKHTVEERTAQIREHEQQIQHQAEDLEELLHLKEKLITNISHEFRTPLTLILGPAKRLLQRASSQRDASQLQLIKHNSQRLLRLVDQLLGLAHLGSEEPLARSAEPVSATVDSIVESFLPLAQDKGLQLSVEQDDELWVNCAPDALENILLNLLSNAIKYTPAGGLITVRTRLGDDDMVEVAVSDTGIGIPKEEHEAVFERFHRVGNGGETVPGAGIGLALVRELVQAHGGRVGLVSELDEGTTVTVKLPRCEAGMPVNHGNRRATSADARALEIETLTLHADRPEMEPTDVANDKPLLLIVEDNRDLQYYLFDLLTDTYQCMVAGDGEEALECAFEHIPDLVLLDLMLPKMDGFQVSHALKEDERTSHIPIMMLTARNDRDSRMESWKEKVDGYLTKPFDDDELRLRIANLLEIRDILKCRFSTEFFADAKPHQAVDQKENGFMKKLEQVLERCHVEAEFGASQIAPELYMSPRQLQRKLKAITGHHPAEFLRSYRLRKARELLQAGMPVGLTADTVGFSSPTYFTSCFKAQFGQTPSEYQHGSVPCI